MLALMTSAQCQENAEDWIQLGNALLVSGEYNESFWCYVEAIKLDPKSAYSWDNKGGFLGEDDYDVGIKSYDEAIQLDPTHDAYVVVRRKTANFYKVLMSISDPATRGPSPVPARSPNLAGVWYYNGNALYNLGKYDDAIKSYDEAIKLNSSEPSYWIGKGLALDKQGKYDESIQAYKKASSINQTYSVSMIDKGNSHYNAGEYVAAIRYSDEAIKQDPKDEDAWYNKATALRMLHRDSEAKAAYTKARELGYSGTMTLMEMTA